MESEPTHKLDHQEMASTETDIATPQTEGATPKKHINDLPKELLARVLGHLPRHDLVRNASAVCWRWHEAAFDQDNWRTIDVHIDDKITTKVLYRLLKGSTKHLYVSSHEENKMMLDEMLPTVLEKCTTLQTLTLHAQQDSSDTELEVKSDDPKPYSTIGVTLKGRCYRNLRKLVFYALDSLTDETLHSILRSCNSIEILFILFCNEISAASTLVATAENARQLTQLAVRFAQDKCLSDDSIQKLADGCPKLRSLMIDANCSDVRDFKTFGKLKNLTCFVISCFPIDSGDVVTDDDVVIHWMTQCRNLKYISLLNTNLTDRSLEAISLSDLVNVRISLSSGITDRGLKYLARSRTLRQIVLSVDDSRSQEFIPVTAHGIVQLAKKSKKLEQLLVNTCSGSPLGRQMEEMSSTWKGVSSIEVGEFSTDVVLKLF